MGKHIVALVCAVGMGMFAAALTASPDEQNADLADLASANKETRKAAVDRLAARGATGVSDLVQRLDDPLSEVARTGVVQAIRSAGGPSASDLPVLRQHLASDALGIRHAALLVLLENPGMARAELTARLSDSDEDSLVRRTAARALGNAGAQSRSTLLRFASAPSRPVRKAVIRALAQCGSAGQDDVEALATDGARDRSERELAVRALAEAGASGALVRLTSDATAFVRAHALAGIGRLGSDAQATAVAARMSDSSADVRLEAMRALRALKAESEHIAAVIACLSDDDVRIQSLACQIIGATTAADLDQIREKLGGLLNSPVFRVRHDAALALHAYGDASGAARMAEDMDSGSRSQRRTAARAHDQISREGN